MYDIWVAIVQGIVEGITEFLPVSSTGHLILSGYLLGFTGDKAATFEIVIQLGAILAVAILYWKRIFRLFGWNDNSVAVKTGPEINLIHVLVAIVPAMIIGLLVHGFVKKHLFSPSTVLIGLVIGGIYMIYAEKRQPKIIAKTIDNITYRQAFIIGISQCLAYWPGFSRSGASIATGVLTGTSHRAAADFSFLIAIPMMLAASGYDLLKSYKSFTSGDFGMLAIGFIVSLIVAMFAVVTFLKLLERVKLTPFAYYRFVLAAVFLIIMLIVGWKL